MQYYYTAHARIAVTRMIVRLAALWIGAFALMATAESFSPDRLPEGLQSALADDVKAIIHSHGVTLSRSLLQVDGSSLSPGQEYDTRRWQQQAQNCLSKLERAGSSGLSLQLQQTQWLIYSPVDLSEKTPDFVLSGFSERFTPTLRVNCSSHRTLPTVNFWPGEPVPLPHYLPRWFVAATPVPSWHARFSPIALAKLIPKTFPQIRNNRVTNKIRALEDVRQSWPRAQNQFVDFTNLVNSGLNHINGNPSTKHGVLAEYLEIASINAKAIVKGLIPLAKKEQKSTHPVDFYIDGVPVQAKSYANVTGSLKAIQEHAQKYKNLPDFENGIYMIPKDQYEVIMAAAYAQHPLTRAEQQIQSKLKALSAAGDMNDAINLLYPASATREQMDTSNILHTSQALEEETRLLYEQRYYKSLAYYGVRSFLSGMITGVALETLLQTVNSYLTEQPLFLPAGWERSVIWAAFSSASSSTMTFYLTALTPMPAPLSGALANIAMRSLSQAWKYYWDEDPDKEFRMKFVESAGQEMSAGLGATLLQGKLHHELAGAYAGLLLWQYMNPVYR